MENLRWKEALTVTDINDAHYLLIRLSQQKSFPDDYKILSTSKISNRLLSLVPFFDKKNKIIRVGGRLSHSAFTLDKKHHILLSAKHQFIKLLFSRKHLNLMHAAPQLLLANIKGKYWPLGGRFLSRNLSAIVLNVVDTILLQVLII